MHMRNVPTRASAVSTSTTTAATTTPLSTRSLTLRNAVHLALAPLDQPTLPVISSASCLRTSGSWPFTVANGAEDACKLDRTPLLLTQFQRSGRIRRVSHSGPA